MEFSLEMIKDYIKCANDVEYFAEKYIKINHPYDGIVPIKLNDFQKQVIKDYNEKKYFEKTVPRMKGKTTVAAIILLHQAMFSEYKVSGIFASKLVNGTNILETIFSMYEMLPEYFKKLSPITKRNRTKLEFGNMCSIINFGSNPNNGKGLTLSNIYIDESDFIDTFKNILDTFYPVIGITGKLFALTSEFKGQTRESLH